MAQYPQNSIGRNLGILIFVEKYLTFTISPDFVIWVFHWGSSFKSHTSDGIPWLHPKMGSGTIIQGMIRAVVKYHSLYWTKVLEI
jgi:hypothetical protein